MFFQLTKYTTCGDKIHIVVLIDAKVNYDFILSVLRVFRQVSRQVRYTQDWSTAEVCLEINEKPWKSSDFH